MALTSFIVWLEAAAVLGGAVVMGVALSQASPLPLAGRVFLIALMLLGAGFQVAVGLNHWRGRAWTRSAVVVWQLFQVVISGQYIVAGAWLFGLALLIPGAVAMVMVFSPQTRAYLAADDAPRG